MKLRLTQILALSSLLVSCGYVEPKKDSELDWGVHQAGRSANLITLDPEESVGICAPSDEHKVAAYEAIQKWSSALGRWGHFNVNPCNTNSTVKINIELTQGNGGLNYFSANPGRIQIGNQARGNYLKAVILHEFGHSYGLCDQYNGSHAASSCSGVASAQQENSEVMGATSESKLQLTQGDIIGVRKAAQVAGATESNWQRYLGMNPQPQIPGSGNLPGIPGGGANLSSILAHVSVSSDNSPRLGVSVASGSPIIACVPSILDPQGKACVDNGTGSIPSNKIRTTGQRDIYLVDMSQVDMSSAFEILLFTRTPQGVDGRKLNFQP